MHRSLLLCALLALISLTTAFDKKQLMKGKYTEEKERRDPHEISRRVLRYERSADENQMMMLPQILPSGIIPSDFPIPEDLQILSSDTDFGKIRPFRILPPKVKPSHTDMDVDYQPDLEF